MITVSISTKDRYFTTLPLVLNSLCYQSLIPNEILIFDDGEHLNLRNNFLYKNIFKNLNNKGINWHVIFGERKGQVHNHQKTIELSKNDFIFRIDDDCIPEPNTIEILFNNFKTIDVGAVSCSIIDPNFIKFLPNKNWKNKIENIYSEPNCQWFLNKGIVEVDHLYSSFMYRKEAAKHGYYLDLSPVCHREETIFTYEMKRNKWKLLVNYNTIIHHYRNPEGGIRSFEQEKYKEYIKHDENIFKEKMIFWKKYKKDDKIIVLDNGLGDHIAFSCILSDIIKKYKKATIACCYPEVFEEFDNIDIISIKEAKILLGNSIDQYNIYKYMMDRNWKKNIIEAYKELYL